MRYSIHFLAFFGMIALAPAQAQPPVAPVVPHVELRYGSKVTDDYYWLRDKSDPKVTAYLNAENAYAETMTEKLKPFEDALYREMLAHIKQTDLSVPVRRRTYLYYTRTEEGKQYPIYCRRKGEDGAEEILVDQNKLAEGQKFTNITSPVPSDDQNLIAYTVDHVGYRQYHLAIKDLRAGELFPDTAERVTSVAWAADNKTLFLVTEDPVNKRSNKLWRHVIGASSLEPLYEEKDEKYRIGIERTRDKKYLILDIESKDTTEVRYLQADHPQENFLVMLPREEKHRYYVDHRSGLFYIRTDKDALNFRVVTAPEDDPSPKNWTSFVPEREDVRISDIALFRDYALLVEKALALDHFRAYNFKSGQWQSVSFPEPVYSAGEGENPDFESAQFRYRYSSFLTSESIYDYDPHAGTSKLLKRQEVPDYDPTQYITDRLWATARDGKKRFFRNVLVFFHWGG